MTLKIAALRIAIAGSGGRMGHALLEAVLRSDDAQLSAALEHAGNAGIGQNAGSLVGLQSDVKISSDINAIQGSDVLIDFTRPEGTLAHLEVARKYGVKLVIGTTGFDDVQKKQIADAAKEIAIVFAPNMSVGTNLLFKLSDIAARVLSADDSDGYDIEIIEAHHRHKIDAPSGTALHLGNIVAKASGRDLAKDAVYGREGVTGERKPSTIGFATVRGGDIIGEHTVMFAGTGERVELTIRSSSRATYAQGALRAARFLADKNAGLFDMQDVLGLK